MEEFESDTNQLNSVRGIFNPPPRRRLDNTSSTSGTKTETENLLDSAGQDGNNGRDGNSFRQKRAKIGQFFLNNAAKDGSKKSSADNKLGNDSNQRRQPQLPVEGVDISPVTTKRGLAGTPSMLDQRHSSFSSDLDGDIFHKMENVTSQLKKKFNKPQPSPVRETVNSEEPGKLALDPNLKKKIGGIYQQNSEA